MRPSNQEAARRRRSPATCRARKPSRLPAPPSRPPGRRGRRRRRCRRRRRVRRSPPAACRRKSPSGPCRGGRGWRPACRWSGSSRRARPAGWPRGGCRTGSPPRGRRAPAGVAAPSARHPRSAWPLRIARPAIMHGSGSEETAARAIGRRGKHPPFRPSRPRPGPPRSPVGARAGRVAARKPGRRSAVGSSRQRRARAPPVRPRRSRSATQPAGLRPPGRGPHAAALARRLAPRGRRPLPDRAARPPRRPTPGRRCRRSPGEARTWSGGRARVTGLDPVPRKLRADRDRVGSPGRLRLLTTSKAERRCRGPRRAATALASPGCKRVPRSRPHAGAPALPLRPARPAPPRGDDSEWESS